MNKIKYQIIQISGEPSRLINLKRKFSKISQARAVMTEYHQIAQDVKRNWSAAHDQEAEAYWLRKNPWFDLTNFEIAELEIQVVTKKTHKL